MMASFFDFIERNGSISVFNILGTTIQMATKLEMETTLTL